MHTVIGSNGQIGYELVKEIYKNYSHDIRLVSRNPQKINKTDEVFAANLLDQDAVLLALENSQIVYFTAGLPMDSHMWEEQFEIMLNNVITACKQHASKLVFFDNTYMYAKNAEEQFEDSAFIEVGRKSTVRAKMANRLLKEMAKEELDVLICRAPEFYGPNRTQSITNSFIFNRIENGKKAFVPISAKRARTLIWTPDASRGMALLANQSDTYNQTWHLPCDTSITYEDMLGLINKESLKPVKHIVIKQ